MIVLSGRMIVNVNITNEYQNSTGSFSEIDGVVFIIACVAFITYLLIKPYLNKDIQILRN
jgi:hypothetical protein